MTGDPSLTPPFDGSPRSIAIIKRAAKEMQQRKILSLTKQAQELSAWSWQNGARFEARPFRMDKQRWSKFVKEGAEYTTAEPDLLPLAWNWLFEKHRFAIEALWRTIPMDAPVISNPLVPTLHAYLSPDAAEINLQRLRLLEGSYAAYRPDFNNVDRIMVNAMDCGVDNDISRFQMTMNYINADGEDTTEHVNGFIIPYQDSVLFQGWMVEACSPFIFILFGFPTQPKTGKISKSEGVLLVGAGGTPPSAFPITIRRTQNVTPGVYDKEDFKKAVPAHNEILPVMARGVVGWR